MMPVSRLPAAQQTSENNQFMSEQDDAGLRGVGFQMRQTKCLSWIFAYYISRHITDVVEHKNIKNEYIEN